MQPLWPDAPAPAAARRALPQVTLCAVDTRAPELALRALRQSMAGLQFGRVVLFTHQWTAAPAMADIEVIDIGPINSGAAYSAWVLNVLPQHIHTSHVLVSQWDGFVADPLAWRDEFLEWDYIGAPWPEQPAGRQVGNGGFSLRSQRLLRAGASPGIEEPHPEDWQLAVQHRDRLEREHGVRFAPDAVGRAFAFENQGPSGAVFGFHGAYNLPRVLSEGELLCWAAALPDGFYSGRDARRLAREALACGQLRLTQAVVQRRLAVGRREPATRVLGWAAWLRSWLAATPQA